MSSRQLSKYTLDRLEASLSRFHFQESSSATALTYGSFSAMTYGSSGSSAGHNQYRYKLVATETKVVQETTHREVVLEGSYGGASQESDGGDSDGGDSYDDGPEEVCYEAPSVEVVGYSESSHQYAEKEYYCEEQGSLEQYEEQSGYGGGYDGGYELDSYGGTSDYGGYYSQDSDDDYY